MEIIWHGNTCFSLKGKDSKVIINPDKEAGKLKGDIVLSSLKEGLAEVEDQKILFDWPGEYESQGIPILGFQAWTKSRSQEEAEGKGESTIIFYLEIDGIKICHLAELGHVLTSDMVNKIGDVDILMIKIGENCNLDGKKAHEVIESIDPRVVIPMGAANSKDHLKDIGSESVESQDSFIVKQADELPEDKRIYVVLNKK